MTDNEVTLAIALSQCRFLPRSWDKRFAISMGEHARQRPLKPITSKQRRALTKLVHKYRDQLPENVVEINRIERERLHIEDNSR